MRHDLDALLAADAALAERAAHDTRRRFLVEIGRRGIFVRLGRTEAYLCGEAESAWMAQREPGCLDVQAWRLHLIVGRVPSPNR